MLLSFAHFFEKSILFSKIFNFFSGRKKSRASGYLKGFADVRRLRRNDFFYGFFEKSLRINDVNRRVLDVD